VIGQTLGPYRVIEKLGQGGMGEVYKAQDTRLERIVAIKILPVAIAGDPSLKERFDREAKTIASLSHPHICPLFDVGHHGGTDYLVMECLEGDTLEQRLRKGALPLEQAVQIGIAIAEALAAAHRAGIVHRDVKPGNIILTRSGPKLLDFGLAKTGVPSSVGGLSMLPTTPHNLTVSGTILGTFQYMAPEQLEGQDADSRTDIFGLGAVLYEMLTGRRPFDGKSQASLIGSILRDSPAAVSAIQPLASPALDRVVQKALEKSPDARWQSAADLADELRWAMRTPAVTTPVTARVTRPFSPASLMVAAVVIGVAFVAGYWVKPVPVSTPRPVAMFQLDLSAGTSVISSTTGTPWFAVSPDGRVLAYRAAGSGGDLNALWIRPMNGFNAKRMPPNGNVQTLFWSYDSKSLAYVEAGVLRVLDLATSVSRVIAPLPSNAGGAQLGGAWSADGTIVLGANAVSVSGGLVRIASSGGTFDAVTKPPANARDASPGFIGNSHTLVFARMGAEQGLYVMSLDGGEPRRLAQEVFAPTVAGEFLFFMKGAALLAQRMDAHGSLTGEPVAVAESVAANPISGVAAYSVSRSGPLVYSSARVGLSQLTWFSAAGDALGTVGDADIMQTLEMSRDGARAVYGVRDVATGAQNLWSLDLQRHIKSRLTFGTNRDSDGTWSPDGSRYAFASIRNGDKSIYVRDWSGGSERVLVKGDGMTRSADDWSPDGKWLLFHLDARGELWAQPTGDSGQPQMVAKAQAQTIDEATFSPDGHWIAYGSGESGRWEIYLVPFPATGARWQVTSSGGMQPQWRGDGRVLYFLTADGSINAADVTLGAMPTFGDARTLFKTRLIPVGTVDQYAVTPDGSRFLVMNPVGRESEPPPTVIVNWESLLQPRTPTFPY